MDKLEVSKLGRKFHHQWIFKDIDFSLRQGESLLLKGPNGSGKSTLLRIISGQLGPTTGTVQFTKNETLVEPAQMFREISWCGPYIDLYPEFSLEEMLTFHFRFRKCLAGEVKEVPGLLNLGAQAQKPLRQFSSGMLARVKAGLAVLSEASLLLLDEPTANMDEENTTWFFGLLDKFQNGRMIIFASNTVSEFSRFQRQLDLKQP